MRQQVSRTLFSRFLGKVLVVGLVVVPWLAAHAVTPYNVQCANESDCPGYMAGLSNNEGVCSTFMITENIMATNLHCIPQDLRHDGASCKGRISAFFPKTSRFEKETADCETILYTSPPLLAQTLSPDFAFYRLSRAVQRETVDLSQAGISDMMEMTIYKVNPAADRTSGKIEKVLCTAVQGTYFNPFFNNDKTPLVALMPCHTIPGNSGSPILSADGKVRGILSAVVLNTVITADPDVKQGMDKGVATLGSNFACLNTFFLGRNQGDPPGCLIKVDAKSTQQMMAKISEKTLTEAETALFDKAKVAVKSLIEQTKKSVRWKLVQVDKEDATKGENKSRVAATFQFQPECLIPPAGDLTVLGPKLRKSETLLPMSWQKYRVVVDLDNYYRPKAKVEEEPISASFVFTPADFVKPKDIAVRIEKAVANEAASSGAESASDGANVLSKFVIPSCRP